MFAVPKIILLINKFIGTFSFCFSIYFLPPKLSHNLNLTFIIYAYILKNQLIRAFSRAARLWVK